MFVDEVRERLEDCQNHAGCAWVAVVSDDYHLTCHKIDDIRVNRNNGMIEIVVTE